MKIVNSLPDRLITAQFLETLEENDRVHGTIINSGIDRGEDPDYVLTFGIAFASGAVAAIAWDPRADRYAQVENVQDADDRDEAADRAEAALHEWIDYTFGSYVDHETQTIDALLGTNR